MKNVTCGHPEKKYHAKGMCHSCYNVTNAARSPEKRRVRQRSWTIKNPEKRRAQTRMWRSKPENKRKQREWKLQSKYGISFAEEEAIKKKQGHVCAICRDGAPTHVDHNHGTGKVRGILCAACNQALGMLREQEHIFLSAVDYLRERGACPLPYIAIAEEPKECDEGACQLSLFERA